MQEDDPKDATPQAYEKMVADIYDANYISKNYDVEAARLKGLITKYKKTDGNELLDVACGTGKHLEYLTEDYEVTGTDLSEKQLEGARQRLPNVEFVQADMSTFDLNHQFDVVTCLFSAIGYALTKEDLDKTVQNMAKHLKPGGVLFIEPWLSPDVWDPSREPEIIESEVPEKHLKVTRTTHDRSTEGNISVMLMTHKVERLEGSEEFTEEHRLAMYTREELGDAVTKAGLTFIFDEDGLSDNGRGIVIGQMPLAA